MKFSIIGIGRVGAALGLVLVARHLVSELVLVGRNPDTAEAEALDLLHATAFGSPTRVYAGNIDATIGSDVIVITLGVRASDPVRTAGGAANYSLLQTLLPDLAAASPNAVVILATNPADASTTLALPLSKLPPQRVIGAGTLLDTRRLPSILSQRLGIHPSTCGRMCWASTATRSSSHSPQPARGERD